MGAFGFFFDVCLINVGVNLALSCLFHHNSVSLVPAVLTSDSVDLQELAANSDHLITTLVGYLGNRPDENDELVEEKHQLAFERLQEVRIKTFFVYTADLCWRGLEMGIL